MYWRKSQVILLVPAHILQIVSAQKGLFCATDEVASKKRIAFISLNLLVSVSLPWFGTPLAFTQYESWAL
jgi:hypothetical protein